MAAGTTGCIEPLSSFVATYSELKHPAWAEPEVPDADRANRRVLGLAREAGWGSDWGEQIEAYMRLHRLALVTARAQPLFASSRTTLWTLTKPAVLLRLAGSYALGPDDAVGWDRIVWCRLPDPESIDLHLLARQQGVTVAQLIRHMIEMHLGEHLGCKDQ
jgi:hypothetical protein